MITGIHARLLSPLQEQLDSFDVRCAAIFSVEDRVLINANIETLYGDSLDNFKKKLVSSVEYVDLVRLGLVVSSEEFLFLVSNTLIVPFLGAGIFHEYCFINKI